MLFSIQGLLEKYWIFIFPAETNEAQKLNFSWGGYSVPSSACVSISQPSVTTVTGNKSISESFVSAPWSVEFHFPRNDLNSGIA